MFVCVCICVCVAFFLRLDHQIMFTPWRIHAKHILCVRLVDLHSYSNKTHCLKANTHNKERKKEKKRNRFTRKSVFFLKKNVVRIFSPHKEQKKQQKKNRTNSQLSGVRALCTKTEMTD